MNCQRLSSRRIAFALVVAVFIPLSAPRLTAAADTTTAPDKKASAAKLPAAKEVIANFVKAIGGKEAVLKTSSSHSVGKMEAALQGLSGPIETFSAKPNKMLQKLTIGGVGETSIGFDGQVGWSVDPMQGPTLLSGKMLDEIREQADFYGILHDEKNYTTMETTELTQFDNKECYKLKLIRASGHESAEYFDTKTGLLVGMSGAHETPLGSMPMTTVIGDYKEFEGIKVPTRLSQKVMGMEMVMTVTTCENNKVPDSVFELPAPIKALVAKQTENKPAEK
jgi:zinc protease